MFFDELLPIVGAPWLSCSTHPFYIIMEESCIPVCMVFRHQRSNYSCLDVVVESYTRHTFDHATVESMSIHGRYECPCIRYSATCNGSSYTHYIVPLGIPIASLCGYSGVFTITLSIILNVTDGCLIQFSQCYVWLSLFGAHINTVSIPLGPCYRGFTVRDRPALGPS